MLWNSGDLEVHVSAAAGHGRRVLLWLVSNNSLSGEEQRRD